MLTDLRPGNHPLVLVERVIFHIYMQLIISLYLERVVFSDRLSLRTELTPFVYLTQTCDKPTNPEYFCENGSFVYQNVYNKYIVNYPDSSKHLCISNCLPLVLY